MNNAGTTAAQCVLKSMSNCKTYADTTAKTQLECTACDEGYILETDGKACTLGTTTNCSTYDASKVCTACKTGYVLLTNTATVETKFCYKIPDNVRCLTLNHTALATTPYNFECSKCPIYDYAVFGKVEFSTSNQASLTKNICMKMPLVDGCISYNSTIKFLSNQFVCTECKNDIFYLNTSTNKCIKRTKLSKSCTVYNKTADQCQTCGTTTFLNTSTYLCDNYPNGIYKCIKYSSSSVCM